jgi:hypothetical protein
MVCTDGHTSLSRPVLSCVTSAWDAPLAHHGFSTLVTIDVGTSVDFVAGPLDVVGGEPVAMAATS